MLQIKQTRLGMLIGELNGWISPPQLSYAACVNTSHLIYCHQMQRKDPFLLKDLKNIDI